MLEINNFNEEKSCVFKDEEYLVRDNGAVLRKTPHGKKPRTIDNTWTFGRVTKSGYLEIGSARIHRIVATAFHGEAPSDAHVVDHIDTNKHNNRPSNLRWLTRLENVVMNPVTRKKIEYITGVDVFTFLENPSAYRDAFNTPDYSWMRRVTAEEARACKENVLKWSKEKSKSKQDPGKKIGDWIYKSFNNTIGSQQKFSTPLAKLENWKTPTAFLCCPTTIEGNPIECYLANLSENSVFAENQYGKIFTEKYVVVNNEAILVITSSPESIKPLALVKITYKNGFYIHRGMGTFFSEEGAEKQFTLAQGLEWTGGDSIDDYC